MRLDMLLETASLSRLSSDGADPDASLDLLLEKAGLVRLSSDRADCEPEEDGAGLGGVGGAPCQGTGRPLTSVSPWASHQVQAMGADCVHTAWGVSTGIMHTWCTTICGTGTSTIW
mmetsp:Transcript_4747/g.13884  ORF Transcript_4747/g.13884 Transcript_4747/m.13884 type:complete len:116 (+) Transcript_4747:1136-1483(+)